MDAEQILMTIAGTLIILLLGIVGYFLKQHIDIVKELKLTVESLTRLVAVLENKSVNLTIGCNQRHNIIDTRLTEHGKRIDANDVEIAKLRTEFDIINKTK